MITDNDTVMIDGMISWLLKLSELTVIQNKIIKTSGIHVILFSLVLHKRIALKEKHHFERRFEVEQKIAKKWTIEGANWKF